MSRLPLLEPAELTPEQRRVYDKIASGARAGVRGPFRVLLHVPELTDRIQHFGAYVRDETCFPPRLAEFATLITARHYRSQYEWHAHEPRARKGGLNPSIIDAIKEGRRPVAMWADETAVYDFTTELLTKGKVSNTTYELTVEAFGARGAVELPALIGYYIMIAMTLFAHEVPLPPGAMPPLK